MKHLLKFIFVTFLVLCSMVAIVDAKGAKKKKRKTKSQREAEKLRKLVNDNKIRVKSEYCAEIEDEKLLHNCLFYNMSKKCFAETFGE